MDQLPELMGLQISSLRDKVLDVLNHQSIKSCIKQALLLNGGPKGFDKLQALQQLQVCGVVDEVIKAAAAEVEAAENLPNACESAEPEGQYEAQMPRAAVQLVPQQQFRPGTHYLHVVLKGGRAFTEYLTRPALPGEKLQCHLLLQGQRIVSMMELAGTSPAFKAEAIIQLPAAAVTRPASQQSNCMAGTGSAAVQDKAAAMCANAAEAATTGSWDDCELRGSNNNTSLNPEMQHLLQLHERLHVVVVSSTPVQGAVQGSYTEAAAVAAATVSAQQRGSTSGLQQQQQQQHAQQLCCQQQLYGVGALDWRKALSRSKGPYITLVELRPGQPDELQSSAAVGAVELHLQLLSPQHNHNQLMYQQQQQQQQLFGPLPAHRPRAVVRFTALPESVVRLQQQYELRVESEAFVGFIKSAKAWWARYLAINPKFKQRNVQVLARCEAGCQHPVAAWLAPLQLGRCLSTAAEAARFVALLGVRQEFESLPGAAAGAGSTAGCWSSLHTCLAAKQASEEELALLLCSLLLGFGLDAWVVNGRQTGNSRGTAASWVLVHEPSAPESSMLWEPSTGLRFGVRNLQSLPFASIDSLFNHRQLLANCQPDSSPAAVDWQLHESAAWLPLDMSDPALHQPLNRLAFPLRPPSIFPLWVEQQLEQQLMTGLAAAQRQLQQDLQGPVASAVAAVGAGSRVGMLWDATLAHLIMPALAAYETEAVLGVAPAAASEVATAIRRATPAGYTFKGVPQHHRTIAAPVILDCLLSLALVREMLLLPWALQQQQHTAASSQDVNRVVYALRVKVTMYPEDLTSVWLMFAAKCRTAE